MGRGEISRELATDVLALELENGILYNNRNGPHGVLTASRVHEENSQRRTRIEYQLSSA